MIIKGFNKKNISKISKIMNEDKKIKNIRCEAFENFLNLSEPMFGPDLKIDYDNITCYNSDELKRKISNFDNIIYCDFISAKEMYGDLFYTYFNNLVKSDSSKYVALNCALANTGTFIYVPPNTKVSKPLTNLINGAFERNIIIVDENSELEYIENLDKSYNDLLNVTVTEVYVKKGAKCKYNINQNLPDNIYNLSNKTAIIEDNASMIWNDLNIGSNINMKYPTCILSGNKSKGYYNTLTISNKNMIQDIGCKMIHEGLNTTSRINSKIISLNGGINTYRQNVTISNTALKSKSKIVNKFILLDDISECNIVPISIIENNTSSISQDIKNNKAKKINLTEIINNFKK